jgi:chemotaxis protein CheX
MSTADSSANPLMDKRLIVAFVDGVSNILNTMAMTPVKPTKPFIEPSFTFKGDVIGTIGMTSKSWRGSLFLCFSKESILSIMQNMLGEEYKEVNQEVRDGVGELTNMVYGSAKAALNQLGYEFDMAIPTVITGDFTVSQTSKGVTLVIPFELPNGSLMHVKISVQ